MRAHHRDERRPVYPRQEYVANIAPENAADCQQDFHSEAVLLDDKVSLHQEAQKEVAKENKLHLHFFENTSWPVPENYYHKDTNPGTSVNTAM
jgi:hypothetical protein